MTAPTRMTVAIPTFNRAAWLHDSLTSVLAQTFTDFRVIVSDNASEDDTAEVVRSFDDPRIDYRRSEHNVGSLANIKRLIALADTEFIVIVPDDDLLYPEHLRRAVELLERRDTVGLVHSAFHELDGEAQIVRRVDPVKSRGPVTLQRRDNALEWLMASRWGLCFPSVVYRTEALVAAGGFRPEDEPFGDRKLWMRLACDWDFGYIATPLVAFRAHPAAITTRIATEDGRAQDARDRARLYDRINYERRMEFLEEAQLDPHTRARLRTIARLQRVVDGAATGLPSPQVNTGLVTLVRSDPRTLLRPPFWRLLAAQLGGRRARAALRAAVPLRPQPR